jgi:hypothetical protein
VWIFLAVLIGLDALRIEIQYLATKRQDYTVNPLHDVYYWIAVQYAVLLFLFCMDRVIKKAWKVFKRQNETAARISQKLRHSVSDKAIREVVRKKMLDKEIRITKAEEFQKLFLFNSPEMTFTFVKIGIMMCCWTLMLYILGFARKVWDPNVLHWGQAALVTVIYVLPTVLIFWFIIPYTIATMSILMSARDLSFATRLEKKTLLELMRISMSEELTLFKSKRIKRRPSSNDTQRASGSVPAPGYDLVAGGEEDETDRARVTAKESHKPLWLGDGSERRSITENGGLKTDTAYPIEQEQQQQQKKGHDASLSASVEAEAVATSSCTPRSTTVTYSETPQGESTMAFQKRPFQPWASPLHASSRCHILSYHAVTS